MSSNSFGSDLLGYGIFKNYRRMFLLALIILLGIGFRLGTPVVFYGHLGRHAYIWELLPFVSGFNPLLGLGLWVGFVAGDFSTKEIGPATGNLGKEYWFILYAAMLAYAFIPALVGRVVSRYSGKIVDRIIGSVGGGSDNRGITDRGTMYSGAVSSSLSGNLSKSLMQAAIVGLSSGATANLILNGLKAGSSTIVPSILENTWRGLYVNLGNDPSCFSIAADDIGEHSMSSIFSSLFGNGTGAVTSFFTTNPALMGGTLFAGAPPMYDKSDPYFKGWDKIQKEREEIAKIEREKKRKEGEKLKKKYPKAFKEPPKEDIRLLFNRLKRNSLESADAKLEIAKKRAEINKNNSTLEKIKKQAQTKATEFSDLSTFAWLLAAASVKVPPVSGMFAGMAATLGNASNQNTKIVNLINKTE